MTNFWLLFLSVGIVLSAEDSSDETSVPTVAEDAFPLSSNTTDSDNPTAKCQLEVDLGEGTENSTRFFYDPKKKQCFTFEYLGEGGNENNFATELDCLSDCYPDVGEPEPLKEEDVILIKPRSVPEVDRCSLPKDNGNCSGRGLSEETQQFYYVPRLETCLAFKYAGCGGNDNRFQSRAECELECKPQDGSVCGAGEESVEAAQMGSTCAETQCPTGYSCFEGIIPQCCNAERREKVFNSLYGEECSTGQSALGKTEQRFMVTVAESCEELLCDEGFECRQRDGGMAKCCSAKKTAVLAELRRDEKPTSVNVTVSLREKSICHLEKEIGNGKEKIIQFYFDPQWSLCLAFKYSGRGGNANRFESQILCENKCQPKEKTSKCFGPQRLAEHNLAKTCNETKCALGFECVENQLTAECCDSESKAKYEYATKDVCENGLPTTKINGSIILGKNCAELRCPRGSECELFNGFAKCCNSGVSRDEPIEAVDCPKVEKRLVALCGQVFTDMEVIRRIFYSPRIISAEGIIQHLNTMCTKYEEYRSCVTMMTHSAACLDPILSRQEQTFGFICQKAVRETVAGSANQRCLRRISKIKKIRDCEDRLQNGLENNIFDKWTICRAFDLTLECSEDELRRCGSNTFLLMKNIIDTLKSNIRQCSHSSAESDLFRLETTTSTSRPTNRNPLSRTRRDSCPLETIELSEKCSESIDFQKIRQIVRFDDSFVPANIEVSNVEDYCNHTRAFRKCMERTLSRNERCLGKLKEDPFYSFIVAFDDRFCEAEKQIRWLMSSGCLKEVLNKQSTRQCLSLMEVTDDRVLCKTIDQMENCIIDGIRRFCRRSEIEFFDEISEMLEKRHRFCSPLNSTALKRSKFLSDLLANDEERSAIRPLTVQGCRNARRVAMFVGHHFIPECDAEGLYRNTQCDKQSGSCWCVDVTTGIPMKGSISGPGRPLPLCGVENLFTCNRLPSRRFCDTEHIAPQRTERWFRDGDKCVSYIHDYCPGTAHIPPIPLRTQSACHAFCLPLNEKRFQ